MDNITIKEYADLELFENEVLNHLKEHEAQNNLPIGLISTLKENKHQFSYVDPVLIAIYNSNELSSVAMMTPPYNLIVTKASAKELTFLANYIFNKKLPIPGVLGPNEEAETFIEVYKELSGESSEVEMNERIYQIESIIPVKSNGAMRIATIDDFDTINEWREGFYIDTDIEIHDPERSAARFTKRIEKKEVAVWEDNGLKSMAGVSGVTPNGVRIGYVYTPPEDRNQGYASAVTAALTKHLLDQGNQFCFLFTDLDNPTSNSIYKKMGYKEVSDIKMIKLI